MRKLFIQDLKLCIYDKNHGFGNQCQKFIQL